MSASSKKFYQITAYILTGLCLFSTVILILTFIFGPKEGMEAMVIIIPWYIAGLMHVGLGVAALICVFLTREYLKNGWIIAYFLLFYGINAYTLAVMNQVDKAISRKVHTITQSEQAELYEILRTMKLKPSPERFQLSPSASARAFELLESGKVDLNYISPGYHRSMIVMAATTGDPKLVELMLVQGAAVDGPAEISHTPLIAAINFSHPQVVKVLLDHGADPNDPRYAYPPLVVAAKEGHTEIARLLLEAGAEPDATTSSSSPALVLAAGKGYAEIVGLLLDHEADPNIVAFGGATPLVAAVKSGCVECVRLLRGAGADGSGTAARDETALSIALKNGDSELIETLKSEAGPKFGNAHDLFFALEKGDIELVAQMLSFGVDPDARDENDLTPLISVATRSKYQKRKQEIAAEAAKLLLTHGANPDLTTSHGETALHRAAGTGSTEVAITLIEAGADINMSTENGQTPLLAAVQKKHNNIAQALLAAGADPNKRIDASSNSIYPLKAAARNNNPEMIRKLFEAGAVIDPGSRDLCDLVQYGAQNPEVIQMIVESGADMETADPLNRYPLDIVVRNGNTESILYLLELGVSPILKDWKGLQPFMRFVRNGQADLVAASLQNSAELREHDKLLRDGMYWAVRNAHPDVVQVMLNYNHRFRRIEEVEALLEWVKIPPATESDKKEVFRLFTEYLSGK